VRMLPMRVLPSSILIFKYKIFTSDWFQNPESNATWKRYKTNWIYSQTWVNDHLRIATTCLQRPQFWGPNFNFHNIKLPLNNDHLSTMATNFGSQGWSLSTSLTVYKLLLFKHFHFMHVIISHHQSEIENHCHETYANTIVETSFLFL